MKQETMFDFLKAHEFLPSREGKQMFASSSELRRWFERGSVEVNGEKATKDDPWPFVGDSVVIHPKGKHRTTLL
jgi:hypothetical protein